MNGSIMDNKTTSALMPSLSESHHAQSPHKQLRNFKLLSDPYLMKGAPKVYRFDGIVPNDPTYPPIFTRDPRNQLARYTQRIEPLVLFVPRFKVDSNYVGEPPAIEITITNINDNIDKQCLSSLLTKCGGYDEMQVFYHPLNNKHLGLAKVVFENVKASKLCIEKYNQTSLMGKILNVFHDPSGDYCKKLFKNLTSKEKQTPIPLAPFLQQSNTVPQVPNTTQMPNQQAIQLHLQNSYKPFVTTNDTNYNRSSDNYLDNFTSKTYVRDLYSSNVIEQTNCRSRDGERNHPLHDRHREKDKNRDKGSKFDKYDEKEKRYEKEMKHHHYRHKRDRSRSHSRSREKKRVTFKDQDYEQNNERDKSQRNYSKDSRNQREFSTSSLSTAASVNSSPQSYTPTIPPATQSYNYSLHSTHSNYHVPSSYVPSIPQSQYVYPANIYGSQTVYEQDMSQQYQWSASSATWHNHHFANSESYPSSQSHLQYQQQATQHHFDNSESYPSSQSHAQYQHQATQHHFDNSESYPSSQSHPQYQQQATQHHYHQYSNSRVEHSGNAQSSIKMQKMTKNDSDSEDWDSPNPSPKKKQDSALHTKNFGIEIENLNKSKVKCGNESPDWDDESDQENYKVSNEVKKFPVKKDYSKFPISQKKVDKRSVWKDNSSSKTNGTEDQKITSNVEKGDISPNWDDDE